MSMFISWFKRIFCVEDNEERQIGHQLEWPWTHTEALVPILRDRHSSPAQSYYVFRRESGFQTVSRTRINAPLTSQGNIGQTTSSSRAHNDLYSSQAQSPCVPNREMVDKNSILIQQSRDDVVKSRAIDAVSGAYASKQPCIPKRENIDNNLVLAKLLGNYKDGNGSSQVALATSSCSVKPPTVTAKPRLSVSENRHMVDKNSVPIQLSRDDDVNSRARDAVSGAYASKQPCIPKRENIDNNLVSVKLSGNYKDGNGSSQVALASSSCSLKPPAVTAKPSLLVSEKPSEIPQKLKILGSSCSMGNTHRWEVARKETKSSCDERHYDKVSSASFKHLQSSSRFPVSSDCFNSSPSTFKTDQPSPSSLFGNSHSPKPPPLSVKPTISLASSNSSRPQKMTEYFWVEKQASSTYVFPKEIKSLIEKDIVPGVLKMPLSKSSYKDYFHALLYAEDYYLEKWDGFQMKNVKVELHKAAIYAWRGKIRNLNENDDKDEKLFVAFELEKLRERRPFLVSRDFVSLQPSNQKSKTFKGVIYRVVKSNLVLAEFGADFYSHHRLDDEYDVEFSFNRVCLKRAHQAIAAASDSVFRNLLFPNIAPKHELPSSEHFRGNKYPLDTFAIHQILRLQGAHPFVVEGPPVVEKNHLSRTDHLSRTGLVIVEAILGIFRADPSKKILLCAPVNKTCDLLMRGLKKEMAESDMFRANAAFRELDGVPLDILPSCLYKQEMQCFSCPSLKELKKFKVILATFMSSFRLYGEGIMAGHFSHIFLIDASSATEPETMVPLTNFATDTTIVLVTGAPRNHSGWIHSKIARENGLLTSYFERLCNSGMYKELHPKVIVQLEDRQKGTNETRSSLELY